MIRYAIRELIRRKGRTAGTVAGYALAVAFLVVSAALGESHALRAPRLLSAPGTKFVVFRPARDQGAFREGGPFAEGVYTEMLTEEDVRRVAGIPGVTSAAPYLLYRRDHPGWRRLVSIGGLDLDRLGTWEDFCAPRDLVGGRSLRPDFPEAAVVTYNCYRPARTGILMTLDLVGLVSLAALGAAVLFAAKSQTASVAERTGEIGGLKAMGWSGRDLLRQILAESFLLAAAGAAAGGVGGILVLLGMLPGGEPLEGFAGAAGAAARGIGLALLGGMVAGGVPAWLAYRTRPAEALRRM